jgi:hypothetical protein
MQAVQSQGPFAGMGVGTIQPDYALTPAQYIQRVIPVAVYPQMEAGRVCLTPADERAEAELERVRSALEQLAPATAKDPAAWAVLKVRELLERVFAIPEFKDDDLWSGMLGDQPVLVVKQSVLQARQMSLDDAVRRVHRGLVAAALQAGMPVPSAVAREHMLGTDAGAERDL